jgi:hypothetical protein
MIKDPRSIVLVIDSQEYVRNFLESGALSGLSNRFEITLIAPHRVSIPSHLKQNFNILRFVELTSNRYFLYRLLNDISTWKYRNLSRTFSYRHNRFYPSLAFVLNKLFDKLRFRLCRTMDNSATKPKLGKINSSFVYMHNFSRFIKGYAIKVLSWSPLFGLLFFTSNPNSVKNKNLFDVVRKSKPSILLFPTSGMSDLCYEIINIALSLNVPSYFLIDNWDNLSSKALYMKLPDYMGVWGQQTKLHAISIQKMSEENVHVLGSARFCPYERNSATHSEGNERNFILFLGSFLYFDEIRALKILNDEMNNNSDIYSNTRILYRPHPLGQQISDVDLTLLDKVILDPNLRNVDFKDSKRDLGNHDLSYYVELFANAKFVVGGLTSMLLESGLNQRKYIAIAYEEGRIITSPSTVLNEYLHLQAIESLDHIVICRNEKLLPSLFRDAFRSPIIENVRTLNSKLRYFVENGSEGFEYRLADSVSKILSQRQ